MTRQPSGAGTGTAPPSPNSLRVAARQPEVISWGIAPSADRLGYPGDPGMDLSTQLLRPLSLSRLSNSIASQQPKKI